MIAITGASGQLGRLVIENLLREIKPSGSVQSSVSRFLILVLPSRRAKAEASSENGPINKLVGGAGFCWSGFVRIIFFICPHSYQIFNSLSSLPSKNIANWEIVRDQFWIGIVHFLLAF